MILSEDARTDFKLSKVCPDVVFRWKKARDVILKDTGRQIRATDGFRSFTDQMAIFAKGRDKDKTGKWIITDPKIVVSWALPHRSFHCFGLAIDSCWIGSDPYLEHLKNAQANALWGIYGRAMKDEGLEWGGDFSGKKIDRPHVQLSYGFSLQAIQRYYEDGGIPKVWEQCKNALLCGGEIV